MCHDLHFSDPNFTSTGYLNSIDFDTFLLFDSLAMCLLTNCCFSYFMSSLQREPAKQFDPRRQCIVIEIKLRLVQRRVR